MGINQWLWPVYARIYDILLWSPLYRELVGQVIESLCLDFMHSLLDAGCGTGNLEREILSRGVTPLEIEAVDLSPQMLNIARKKISDSVQFKHVDLNQRLGYADASFDRIAMIHVLYALSNPSLTLQELFRVLRPKGILVIANPRKGASMINVLKANLLRLAPLQRFLILLRMSLVIFLNLFIVKAGESGHYHFWEKQEWESQLGKIGFSNLSISLTYGDQDYLIVARKDE